MTSEVSIAKIFLLLLSTSLSYDARFLSTLLVVGVTNDYELSSSSSFNTDLQLSLSSSSANDTSANDNSSSLHTQQRPIIYTYFQRLEPKEKFTGMSDEDDTKLLKLWKQIWFDGGWQPVVLTAQDAINHEYFTTFQADLDRLHLDAYGHHLFCKWLAMAFVGGGWYADYDVFPLVPPQHFVADISSNGTSQTVLPNKGELTLFDIFAPSLASGSAKSWFRTGVALLDNAKFYHNNNDNLPHQQSQTSKKTFWTDSLGLLNLSRNDTFVGLHSSKRVLPGELALKKAKIMFADCDARPFRGKLAVHFGYSAILKGNNIKPEHRLPRYRSNIASDWLPMWYGVCKKFNAVMG